MSFIIYYCSPKERVLFEDFPSSNDLYLDDHLTALCTVSHYQRDCPACSCYISLFYNSQMNNVFMTVGTKIARELVNDHTW